MVAHVVDDACGTSAPHGELREIAPERLCVDGCSLPLLQQPPRRSLLRCCLDHLEEEER